MNAAISTWSCINALPQFLESLRKKFFVVCESFEIESIGEYPSLLNFKTNNSHGIPKVLYIQILEGVPKNFRLGFKNEHLFNFLTRKSYK